MSKKQKKIRWLQQIHKWLPCIGSAREIKDIENNTKHGPKGQRK